LKKHKKWRSQVHITDKISSNLNINPKICQVLFIAITANALTTLRLEINRYLDAVIWMNDYSWNKKNI
jgi:hypothetical protein